MTPEVTLFIFILLILITGLTIFVTLGICEAVTRHRTNQMMKILGIRRARVGR